MKLMNICRELIMEAYSGDSSITEYYVKFEASDYSEILYKGIDKVRAMAAFDGFDDVLTYYDNYMYVVMEGVVSHYKFIEDDDIKDYPIEYYYDDDTVYKLISTEEPETIERRKVKPPNRDSDEVLHGVQNYFQMRYGKRKYIKISIGGIQIRLRISDHTENIRNADKGGYVDYHISVVIADMDKTVGIFGNRNKRERRKNEFELRYDSGDKVADIILSINNFIKELVKNHNLMEGRYIKTTISEYLNEVEDISAESFDDKIWYHGSDKPVRKFSFSLIGVDNKKITNYHGYGIYFIDKIERAKRYGDVITLASIDENSDFLVGRITPKQLIKIYKQLKIENVKLRDNDEDWFTNPTYGEYSVLTDVEEFYDFFMRVYKDSFKNIKDVTEFLLRSGIDGMQVTNDVGDNILVVFNEDVINIEDNLNQ